MSARYYKISPDESTQMRTRACASVCMCMYAILHNLDTRSTLEERSDGKMKDEKETRVFYTNRKKVSNENNEKIK